MLLGTGLFGMRVSVLVKIVDRYRRYDSGSCPRSWNWRSGGGQTPMAATVLSGSRACSAEEDAVAAEVGGDGQLAAERLDVADQGADVGGAGVGALDGGHLVRRDAHVLGDLGLGQAEPGALLGQRPGAVAGGQGGRAVGDLGGLPGEELPGQGARVVVA